MTRWYNHIKSYETEFNSLPGSSAAGEAFLSAASAPAAAAEDDDDEVDLFGSDDEEADEEAERIKAERVAAYNAKKANKPKTTAKSVVTFEVKPWDDETDMAELEKAVRSIEQPGLVWGASKLVPIGYGIKKLQITIVVGTSGPPVIATRFSNVLMQRTNLFLRMSCRRRSRSSRSTSRARTLLPCRVSISATHP